MSEQNQHWGSTLDDFLHDEGISEAAKAEAATQAMRFEGLRAEIQKGFDSGESTPLNIECLSKKFLNQKNQM